MPARSTRWFPRRARKAPGVDPRVASINARAAIQIECTADHEPFDDAGTYNWRDYKRLISSGKRPRADRLAQDDVDGSALVDEAILEEVHHRQYGRPWALGKYIFDFVVARGLQPHHRLLDIGCGALRFGVPAIDYLDAERYCGVDVHLKSLEAAVTYELPLHGLESKRPRLLWSDSFDFGHFGGTFDWAVDFFTSVHVPEQDRDVVYSRAAAALAPGGRLLVCPEPRVDVSGLTLVHEELQRCPMLEGHGFDATNHWFEYVRSG